MKVATSLYKAMGILILIAVVFDNFGPRDTLLFVAGLLFLFIAHIMEKRF